MKKQHAAGHGSAPSRQNRKGSSAPSVNEKAGFPGADLPGKTQSRDRSNGVPRVRNHPNMKGL